ncbi:hypothetical protein D3C71_152580 [compost metagenome]
MNAPAASISAKRIGYLRKAPAAGEPHAAPSTAAVKSMWIKLFREGLLVCHNGTEYSRTEDGDEALSAFDRGLGEPCRLVLNAVKAGESRAAVMKGMLTVFNAGLVEFMEGAPYYRLTEAGLAAADPIGEEGYFQKSGNRVFVHGLCTDKGYEGNLQVERLDGESKGKRMLIPRDAFVSKAVWEAMTG